MCDWIAEATCGTLFFDGAVWVDKSGNGDSPGLEKWGMQNMQALENSLDEIGNRGTLGIKLLSEKSSQPTKSESQKLSLYLHIRKRQEKHES